MNKSIVIRKRRVYLYIFILLILNLTAGAGHADIKTIAAIIGEAADQPINGQIALACAIRNRPEGLQGVYGAKLQRNPTISEVEYALWALRDSQMPGLCWALIKGADMWCSDIEQCRKAWRHVSMVFIVKIGDHSFYRRVTGR